MLAFPALSMETLVLQNGHGKHELGLHIEYLEDVEGKLSFEQAAASPAYAQSQQAVINFGFTNSVYWLRFRLHNPTEQVLSRLLENAYPPIDYLDLYRVDASNNVSVRKSGDRLPFDSREIRHKNVIFPISLQPKEETTFYLRVQTESSVQLPLSLWSEIAFLDKDQEEQFSFGIFYGILLAMLIHSVLIYFSIREINHLHYVHFAIGAGFFLSSLNGLAFEYLWPAHPAWSNTAVPFFLGIANSGMINFTRSFLETKRN